MLNDEARSYLEATAELKEKEWRRHQFATAALMMLDRLDVSPEDQLRVQAIASMIRKLGNMEKENE
jgi:hypothetical protein